MNTADTTPKYALIAGNPYSGALRNRERVQALARALDKRGIPSRVVWDRSERDGLLKDEALRTNCRCIVAAGGDGTVADAINARPRVPLVVFPLGTENLFARHFGFTNRPDSLAAVIAGGVARTIDLGRVRDRDFSLLVSAGFDAEIVRRVGRWREGGRKLKRVSYLSYVQPAWEALRRYDYAPIEIEADGTRATGAQVFIFNLPRYSLGLPVAPHAQADDGLLDWVVLKHGGTRNLLGYVFDICASRHLARPDVAHGRARWIRLAGARPVPVEIDGDPAGFTPVEVSIAPRRLTVLSNRPRA